MTSVSNDHRRACREERTPESIAASCKDTFTSGDVAILCRVAPRTASSWVDSGKLPGYTIPGSHDRRILRENLVRFLVENRMPLRELEGDVYRKILFVACDASRRARLAGYLQPEDGFVFRSCESAFKSGLSIHSYRPSCVVVDLALGRVEAGQIAAAIRECGEYDGVVLAAIDAETDHDATRLLDAGYDAAFPAATGDGEIATRIRRLIAKKRGELK